MTDTSTKKLQEWRRSGMIPVAGAFGYAFSLIHVYGFGPYFEPIGIEFGWSRAQVTAGVSGSMLVQAVFAIPVGMAVDRFGPRRIALTGVAATGLAVALLGTATGGAANWFLLWAVLAMAVLGLQATVWASAIASRFSASRGLALGVMLCGGSIAATLFPWMGTELIAAKGWRMALVWHGAAWFAITFPLVALVFRGDTDDHASVMRASAGERRGGGFMEGLRSPIYLRLLLACLLFSFVLIGLVVHFVPMLTGNGMERTEAAKIAGIVGIASFGGRLGTGLLLDRFPGPTVGAGVLSMASIGSLVMVLTGATPIGAIIAALLIGFTIGADVDVIAYLITRYFGLDSFGALYGGLLVVLLVGTAIGSLGASWIFDTTGSYTAFLWFAAASTGLSAALFLTLPHPTDQRPVS